MNGVQLKTMLRGNIFSVFLAGLALMLLLGTFFWCYSVLKAIYVVDKLTDQNLYNKEVILSQTASNHYMENLSQPGEIAAPQAPSQRVEKALLPVDTVAAVGAKPKIYNTKISKQIPFSGEQLQPVSEQAVDKKELQITPTANQNLNNSAENSSTAKIPTFNATNTSENYKSIKAAELYQQIIVNQQQTKQENVGQTVAINTNDPVEKQAASSMNSVAEQNENDIYTKVVVLRLEIDRLTERIESGLSDSDYDFYTHLKSPVFVIHDRERLEAYQKILDKMLLDMAHL